MPDVLCHTLPTHVGEIVLNRPDKANALTPEMIRLLTEYLKQLEQDPQVHTIHLYANGKHFCAGADLQYMQQMIDFTEEENRADADALALLFTTLYECQKPTLLSAHGACYGGALGLIAAADIVIASEAATFCFPEVKLGLIPATIAPFVIHAMGARAAMRYFLSAETFDATTAKSHQLVHDIVSEADLISQAQTFAAQMAASPTRAMIASKQLIRKINPIDAGLHPHCSELIAAARVSEEAQQQLKKRLLDQ